MTLFTHVRSEGKHVIVNYELRSLITRKNGDYTYSEIIGVTHTLLIYDLEGNLLYTLKDLSSVDGAVVSNNGQYMMFTFGGIGLATANNPFRTIEREGWALMRLSDQKVVYKEFTDDGKLAFNRLYMDKSGLIKNTYSTPSDSEHYDYHLYFDAENKILYKKLWIQKEWDESKMEREYLLKKRINYLQRFNFDKISIE
jgi:hypothetical protein